MMRAKEYIRDHRDALKHADEISAIIAELLPLRASKSATDEYFNNKLSADIRYQAFLFQKEMYAKGNAMQQTEPTYIKYEGECPPESASEIRDELFECIKEDKSFGYLYFILGNLQNTKRLANPIDCIPDDKVIAAAIEQFRDDYPRKDLGDYLDETINYNWYETLTEEGITDEAELLAWFNNAYRVFDEVRLIKGSPLVSARYYNEDTNYPSEKAKELTYEYVCDLLSSEDDEDKHFMRICVELAKMNPRTNTAPPRRVVSEFKLSTKKGKKTDLIRVINILLEMGFFIDKDGDKAVKQDFFNALGDFLDEDFSAYSNYLSTTMAASNRDQKCLTKVFEDMLTKQKDIIGKKE